MNCKKCGGYVNPNFGVCAKCGAGNIVTKEEKEIQDKVKITKDQFETYKEMQNLPYYEQEHKKEERKKRIIATIFVLGILIAIIIYAVVLFING